MKYAYENLSPNQFEALVVAMCPFVLGAAVVGGQGSVHDVLATPLKKPTS